MTTHQHPAGRHDADAHRDGAATAVLEVSGVQAGSADDDGARKLHALVNKPLKGIPSTVLIGTDGRIRSVMGPSREDAFRQAFGALVE